MTPKEQLDAEIEKATRKLLQNVASTVNALAESYTQTVGKKHDCPFCALRELGEILAMSGTHMLMIADNAHGGEHQKQVVH